MPKPNEKPQRGWLAQSFKAACFMAVGAAGLMVWQALGLSLGGKDEAVKGPYDTAIAEKARAQTEEAAFAMREQARAICTAGDTDLAVLRGVKLVFDRRLSADNIDRLIARTDKDFNAYGGLNPIHDYSSFHDYGDRRENYTGDVAQTEAALAALAKLRGAGVPVMGYLLEEKTAEDHVAAIYEVKPDGKAYLALGYVRSISTRGSEHSVSDTPALDAQAFAMVMQKLDDGAMNEPGRYAVYKNPFTVNGAGWRLSKIDGAQTVERVKGHPDTALKVPGGICLK